MSTTADLFNPAGAEDAPSRSSDVYKVSYKDGKNGIYQSVIRFVPFYANPSKNVMQKYVSWVKNPITQKGMYVDDISDLGQSNPVSSMYFRLKKTGVATYEQFAKEHLSSKRNYASLVQIIRDEQHPELEGKIKVFVYGKTIYDKLKFEQFGQVAGQQGIIPFDPFRGRYFSIICTNKSNYNNFDNSQFFDNKDQQGNILPSGIWYLNPETNKMEVANDKMNRQYLVDYLSANSPDLNKYDVQPWSEEQIKHVNETLAVIENYISTGNLATSNNATASMAMATLQAPVQQQGVMFPGATTQPSVTPTPVQGFTPQQPVPNAGGFVPQPQPSQGFVPQPQTPSFAQVSAPDVSPQGGVQLQQESPAAGINMDDILSQL